MRYVETVADRLNIKEVFQILDDKRFSDIRAKLAETWVKTVKTIDGLITILQEPGILQKFSNELQDQALKIARNDLDNFGKKIKTIFDTEAIFQIDSIDAGFTSFWEKIFQDLLRDKV